jgi:hypothetical protein
MGKLNVFIDGSWLFKACAPERMLARTEFPNKHFPLIARRMHRHSLRMIATTATATVRRSAHTVQRDSSGRAPSPTALQPGSRSGERCPRATDHRVIESVLSPAPDTAPASLLGRAIRS